MLIQNLREIIPNYDVFLLDQYGVLHNGEALLPGVAEALEALHDAGKALVVLSNTSKRRSQLVAELPTRGFKAEWLAGAVCSGEECYKALADYKGKKCLFLGWERDGDARYLDGSGVGLANAQDADLIVAHGPDLLFRDGMPIKTGFKRSHDLAPYAADLEICAQRRLPMLCANPDQVSVDPAGIPLAMPGTIADAYRGLGGDVIDFGKPGKEHFFAAIDAVQMTNPRVVHVGDSLNHDITGANNAGIDSVFVAETGVHAADLGSDWTLDDVHQLSSFKPTYVIPRFRL